MTLLNTRKSRFFVVLLHLLGVSRHVPSSYLSGAGGWNNGIIGVNPLSVALETLDPSTLLHDMESRILLEKQPHWLQDVLSGDQKCLDPMGGFSECGDATSWMVVPKYSSKRHAKWKQWITWATEEEETEENTSNSRIHGYALQLIDDQTLFYHHDQRRLHQQSRRKSQVVSDPSTSQSTLAPVGPFVEKECLTRRRKDNELILAPCSQDRAWGWQFNEDGILHFKKSRGSASNKASTKSKRLSQKSSSLECLGRNATHAILIPCDGRRPLGSQQRDGDHVIQLAIVRQVATNVAEKPSGAFDRPQMIQTVSAPAEPKSTTPGDEFSRRATKLPDQTGSPAWRKEHEGLPPSRNDIAHSHASINKAQGNKDATTPNRLGSFTTRTQYSPFLPFQVLPQTGRSPSTHGGHVSEAPEPAIATANLESSPTSPPAAASIKSTVRKIQVNSYVATSEDEKYTDPQTGLVFRTDICNYLGHERTDVGRHTLVGVGYYTKTVFNIKVYGVAFYVSKRDVLADPAMEEFASLSTEEMRARPDFYDVLRKMKGYSPGKSGTFDRTVFLKTNMQLATDTMRSSLDADWKFLTPEAKGLLIGSSMKPRPASQAMLDVIISPDNPSRCSCAQIAPAEYNADPDCCARGTELVFTWRKDGNLEARLNGDFMDSFARPDIAEAIFFEYLRLDDPMSTDFIEHAVDGFPMMLGPLSQVKGVSSPAMTQSTAASTSPKGQKLFSKAVDGVGGLLSSGASNVAGFVHTGANELGSGAISAARSVGDAAKNLGGEIDRRRERIAKHVSHFAHQAMTSVYVGKEARAVAALPKWLETMPRISSLDENIMDGESPSKDDWKTRILTRVFGGEDTLSVAAPDEILPMIYQPTSSAHSMFLWVVHLYLLLMLITSLPTHLTRKSSLESSRKGACLHSDSDSDSETGSSIGSDSERGSTMPMGSLGPSPGNSKKQDGIKYNLG